MVHTNSKAGDASKETFFRFELYQGLLRELSMQPNK